MLYPIAIERDLESNTFGVAVPDIPGCFSHGDTLDEAVLNAKEAINLHLDLMAEDGFLPPVASTIEAHYKNSEFEGWLWAIADVDIEPYMGKSHKINVTLPDLLAKRIDDAVAANPAYKTRSHFLQLAALQLIGPNSKSTLTTA